MPNGELQDAGPADHPPLNRHSTSTSTYSSYATLSNIQEFTNRFSLPQSSSVYKEGGWDFGTDNDGNTGQDLFTRLKLKNKFREFPGRLAEATPEDRAAITDELKQYLQDNYSDEQIRETLLDSVTAQYLLLLAQKELEESFAEKEAEAAKRRALEKEEEVFENKKLASEENARELKTFSTILEDDWMIDQTMYGYHFDDAHHKEYAASLERKKQDEAMLHTLFPRPKNFLGSFVTSIIRWDREYALETDPNTPHDVKYFFYEEDNRLHYVDIDTALQFIIKAKKAKNEHDNSLDDILQKGKSDKLRAIVEFISGPSQGHIQSVYRKWGFGTEKLKNTLTPPKNLTVANIFLACAVSVNLFKSIPYASLFINVIAISGFFYNFHNEKTEQDYRRANHGKPQDRDRLPFINNDAVVLGLQTFVTTAYTVAMTSKTSTKFEATLGLKLAQHLGSSVSPLVVSAACGLIVAVSLMAVTAATRYAQNQEIDSSELALVGAVGFLAGFGMDLWSHLPTNSSFSPHYRSVTAEYGINMTVGALLKWRTPNREAEIRAMRAKPIA